MVFYKMIGNEMSFQLLDNNVRKVVTPNKFEQGKMNKQYVRDIVIRENNQNVHYAFGFRMTANEQLVQAFQNTTSLGINPFEVIFVLRKMGQKLDTTYTIVVGERIGIPQNVIEPFVTLEQADKQFNVVSLQTPQKQPVMQLQVPPDKEQPLSDVEKELLVAFENYIENCSQDRFVEVANYNLAKQNTGILVSRLIHLYNTYYRRK